MDGLLIDSEPLWREAEIDVFSSLGLSLTEAMCRQTTGLRVDEVVRYWHARLPWTGDSHEQVAARLLAAAERRIIQHGSLMDGARDTVVELHDRGAQLAIASSSPMRLIRTVVERFDLERYFKVLHSAEHEAAGKPDPAVYRTTIARLGADPADCVAFEDSLSGVRAAKSAGATVIAVPAPDDASDPRFAIADVTLASLKFFSLQVLQHREGIHRISDE